MRTSTPPARIRIALAATAAAAAAAITLAALTACSSASGGTTNASTTAGNGSNGGANQASGPHNADYDEGQAIVQCYRQHGDPSFPDQVYDPTDGHWHFGVSPNTAPQSTRAACQHLFPSVNPSPPVPQAQFQQLVRLAECLRQHGVPQWPDPAPDGVFPLPPSLLNKSAAQGHAMSACQALIPSGGINVMAAP